MHKKFFEFPPRFIKSNSTAICKFNQEKMDEKNIRNRVITAVRLGWVPSILTISIKSEYRNFDYSLIVNDIHEVLPLMD